MNKSTTTNHSSLYRKECRIKNKEALNHFSQLHVWQLSKNLSILIYKWTQKFPTEEKYGLVSQLRRASVSVPSNIAEGFGRRLPIDKAHFYTIARGSLDEVQCQLIISYELTMLSELELDSALKMCTHITKILNTLIARNRNCMNASS